MTRDEAERRVDRIIADRETVAAVERDPIVSAWHKADAEALSLMMTCSVEDCGRPVQARGLCAAHYKQVARGSIPGPTRTSPGEGDAITVRVTRELRQKAASAAAKAGRTESEWWREAGEEKLEREGGDR